MNLTHWILHFRKNRLNRIEPSWTGPLRMDDNKRTALAASLAEYQLGDGGGPCRLIASDAEALRASDDRVREVIDLWFAEEKEHSRLLHGAVTRLRGTLIEDSYAFRLFNQCRRIFDAQFEMLVLLIVEIVSTGYYRVIRRHCNDKPISDMCRLILRDEAGHVAFHRDRLRSLYPEGIRLPWKMHFFLLGYACTAFLWLGHGRWLRTIGGSWTELQQHVQSGLTRFARQLEGHHLPAVQDQTSASCIPSRQALTC
tara:strand:- start:262 stop:1026 length:765 start_codon:yes stop_codon:yes gene_type:complete